MFKRNQVEEAIAGVFEPGSAKPSSETRTRLKRLLETDRGLGRNKRSADPERAHFAFYSTEGPGRGVENRFSDYEAFALLIGLRLMRLGWPQGLAVAVLRRVKPALETHHARMLEQAPAQLSDEQRRQQANPGDLVSLIVPTPCSSSSVPRIEKIVRAQIQLQYAGARSSWCASFEHRG